MAAAEIAVPPATTPEMRSMLRDLQDDIILWALPAVALAGLLLIACESRFGEPLQADLPGVLLLVLPVAVWALRGRNYLIGAWALAVGVGATIALLATWAGASVLVCLLGLSAGLAALFVSMGGGVLAAAGCSIFLALGPRVGLPADAVLRLTALLGVWATVGLIWLTTRPLLTILQWSWAHYERNCRLLDQARDHQVQLKQTLADLADANLQLTRLNRLAQGLRRTAEEARMAKEQFVANVSHELRTPLNMIIGFSEMVVRAPQVYGHSIPPALLADLAVILRNSQHLASLIDDVLDLSQIETGKMALSKERVTLSEVVEAAITAVQPLFSSKGLYLRKEIAPDLPAVLCDRTRIREVVLNLLSNAGRFVERGGVCVRAWREQGDVLLSVADTGPGIAEESVARVFQPFQQVDGSIRRRYGGSGLGLFISHSLVELHGGQMWLESQVGAGTTFYVRLPIEPPLPADDGFSRWFSPHWYYEERTRPSLAPVPVVRPRLVVVEAGETLQRLLTRYDDGVEVVGVPNLEAAAREMARVPAQALLVNDAAVGDALQQLSRSGVLPDGTPAIICSVPGIDQAAGDLGAADYLVKPIARDTLLAALERLHLGGRTVLIVDDEPEALQLFQRILASAEPGYRVLRASDGRGALRVLREQRVDAVLLDLVMPDMDGFQLLRIRSQDPELRQIPVVIISARDPAGQPIVAHALAATQSGGLSMPRLLACIRALSGILSAPGLAPDPTPPGTLPG